MSELNEQNKQEKLQKFQKYIHEWYSYNRNNYYEGRLDKIFLYQTQWDSLDMADLTRLQMPILTFNKCHDVIKKIIGEQAQSTPQLRVFSKNYVSPTDDQANIQIQKKINLRQNLIRSISYDCQGDIAVQTTYKNIMETGYGAFKVYIEYEPRSFNQCIKYNTVLEPEKCFFDPSAKSLTKEDSNFCGEYYRISKEQFEILYPNVKYPISFKDAPYLDYFDWGDNDTITLVDFYEKEWFTRKIYFLDNGETLTEEEFDAFKKFASENEIPIPTIIAQREEDDYKIYCYRCIYGEILETYEWSSKFLPYVYVPGNIYRLDGKEYTESFIRQAKDPQRFLNYLAVSIAQYVKNARKELYLVTPENIRGYEKQWQFPEVVNGALIYNPDPDTKEKPQRVPASEIPQSLYQHYLRAESDIQSILGYFNANTGAPTPDIMSGVALKNKIRQGNASTYIFQNHLEQGFQQVGRVILDLIPKVYDNERPITLRLANGKYQTEMINNGTPENDLIEGEFDVIIESGPSFEIQKENMLTMLMQFVSANPQVFPLIADMIADNFEIENREQLVERLRTLVPPDIIAKEKGEPPPPPPPQQPNPDILFKIKDLQNKEKELQLKSRSQEIEALKTMLNHKEEMSSQEREKLRDIAELTKAKLDNQTNTVNAFVKLLDAHAKGRVNYIN